MRCKKNPIEKYFFIMEKNDFENFDFQKKLKFLIFSIEKSIFEVNFLLQKIDFSIEKIKIFDFFSKSKFSKSFFPKIFFDPDFFLRSRIYLYFRFRTSWAPVGVYGEL